MDQPRLRLSTTQTWKPSSETMALNSKREFLPSETAPVRRKSLQPKSTVFAEDQPQQLVKPRLTLERPAQAGKLLQYKYAIPFRSEAVTEKPLARLLKPSDFTEVRVRNNLALLYRIRQNTGNYN